MEIFDTKLSKVVYSNRWQTNWKDLAIIKDDLSKNILEALDKRKACLMSNHGQVVFDTNLEKAFELAEEIENICHQYINTLKIGIPKILSNNEMKKVLEKVKDYKKE